MLDFVKEAKNLISEFEGKFMEGAVTNVGELEECVDSILKKFSDQIDGLIVKGDQTNSRASKLSRR